MLSINLGNAHPIWGDFELAIQAFVDDFILSGFSQWVTESTFLCSGNILDLVFTSAIDLIGDVNIYFPFPQQQRKLYWHVYNIMFWKWFYFRDITFISRIYLLIEFIHIYCQFSLNKNLKLEKGKLETFKRQTWRNSSRSVLRLPGWTRWRLPWWCCWRRTEKYPKNGHGNLARYYERSIIAKRFISIINRLIFVKFC